MAHISSAFANASPGRLCITFIGTFYEGTARDAGFPAGSSNMLLTATIGGVSMQPIDRFAPVSYMELDYPGGNLGWYVATSTVAVYTGGVATYGFQNLSLTLQLIKK